MSDNPAVIRSSEGPVLKLKLAMVRSLSRALAGTDSYRALVTRLDALTDLAERRLDALEASGRQDRDELAREVAALDHSLASAWKRLEQRLDHADARQKGQADELKALASGLDRARADLRSSRSRLDRIAEMQAELTRAGEAHGPKIAAMATLLGDMARRAVTAKDLAALETRLAADSETRLRDTGAALEAAVTAVAGQLKARLNGTQEALEGSVTSLADEVKARLNGTQEALEGSVAAVAEDVRSRLETVAERAASQEARTAALARRFLAELQEATSRLADGQARLSGTTVPLERFEAEISGLRSLFAALVAKVVSEVATTVPLARFEAEIARIHDLFAAVDARVVAEAASARDQNRVLFADTVEICIQTGDGQLLFPRRELNHALSYVNRGFDEGIRRAVVRLCSPGAHFIDIGASVGVMSVVAAHRIGTAGRITLVEPLAEIAAFAERNVRLNAPLVPLEVRIAAASAKAGEARIQVFPDDTRISTLHPYAQLTLKSEMRSVPLLDAADLLGDSDLTVVKIDAEGEDLTILKRLLGKRKGALRALYEHSPDHLRRSGQDPADILGLASKHGMVAHFLDEQGDPSEQLTAKTVMQTGNVQLVDKDDRGQGGD